MVNRNIFSLKQKLHLKIKDFEILVKFWLRQSDVMLRIVMLFAMLTVMRCVPYHVPKAHFTSKGNITHEAHITLRLRNTSLKKDGYFRNRLFSEFGDQNDNSINLVKYSALPNMK